MVTRGKYHKRKRFNMLERYGLETDGGRTTRPRKTCSRANRAQTLDSCVRRNDGGGDQEGERYGLENRQGGVRQDPVGHVHERAGFNPWIPAYAGMTEEGTCSRTTGIQPLDSCVRRNDGGGGHVHERPGSNPWIPAYAGMTERGDMFTNDRDSNLGFLRAQA